MAASDVFGPDFFGIDVPADFGDAPSQSQSGFLASYPTRSQEDGARHAISGLYLGAKVDEDLNGVPSINARDPSASDDDGVRFESLLLYSDQSSSSWVTVIASASGKLDAWIDFDHDGDWSDVGEQIFASASLEAGDNRLTFSIPSTAQSGTTYARFRFSTAGGLAPTGFAFDGEVEDYAIKLRSATSLLSLSELVGDGYEGIRSIDLSSHGAIGVSYSEQAVLRLSDTKSLRITLGNDDALKSSLDWSYQTSQVIGSRLVHRFTNGEAVMETDSPKQWQNAFNLFDSNANGQVEAADVLAVINQLQRAGRSGSDGLPEFDPSNPRSFRFVDTNGNGVLEPIDVLLIINSLNRRSTVNVYSIGNSLTVDLAASVLDSVGAGEANPLRVGFHAKCGENLTSILASPTFCLGSDKFGQFPNALTDNRFDVITLQPFYNSTIRQEVESAKQMVKKLRSREENHSTRILIYATWSQDFPSLTFLTTWQSTGATLDSPFEPTAEVYQLFIDELRKSVPEAELLPVGHTFYAFAEKINQGLVSGISSYTDLYRDYIHASRAGRYLADMVAYAMIYRKSPEGRVGYPSVFSDGTSPEFNQPAQRILAQQTAWEVVASFNPRWTQP